MLFHPLQVSPFLQVLKDVLKLPLGVKGMFFYFFKVLKEKSLSSFRC